MEKIKHWLARYLPSEILAVIGALLGGLVADALFHNGITTAIGAMAVENTCYFGSLTYRELKRQKQKHKKNTLKVIIRTARNLILEFGPAEYIDATLVRPFAQYFFPKLLGNIALGLIVGKFAADAIFYVPTIISYELRKKFLKE